MKNYEKETNERKIERINITIKKFKTCPNLKCGNISEFYKSFPTFHFYLEENPIKEYSIKNFINDYFKKENEAEDEYKCSKCSNIFKIKSKSLFYQLPEAIIILIYYGKENNNYKNYYYDFEEILDFTNDEYMDKNIKNKKYFLSSIITCKYPKSEKEYFYTFCRKDYGSNFLIYYSKEDKGVRVHNAKINRQIKRLKKEEYDREKSYPYILIYTSLENKLN